MAVNGKLAAGSLFPTGQAGMLLVVAAAASFARTAAEVYRRYGWKVKINDAYRDYDTQVKLFLARFTTTPVSGVINVWWNGKRWYLRPGQSMAAIPGTSNHGWGLAIDVDDLGGFNATKWKQFREVAARNGWNNDEGKSIGEWWHWVYVAANDDGEDEMTPEQEAKLDQVLARLGEMPYRGKDYSLRKLIQTIGEVVDQIKDAVADIRAAIDTLKMTPGGDGASAAQIADELAKRLKD